MTECALIVLMVFIGAIEAAEVGTVHVAVVTRAMYMPALAM